MTLAEVAFKAVDIICYKSQNDVHFEGIVSERDIPYDSCGNPAMKGDLYYKKEFIGDSKKRPVIVYIHGGGFVMGSKDYRISIAEYYANEGYYVFNINHRMPPEVAFPENISDCIVALNYLKVLAEKYPLDLDNIVLTGDSSGAYMCAYLAAAKYDDDLREKLGMPKFEVELKGLMLMCGIYDIEVLIRSKKLFGVIPSTARLLMDFDLKDDYSNLKDYQYKDYISPINFVNNKWCSAFISWADDDLVCAHQGEGMASKLGAVCPKFDSFHIGGLLNNHCYHLTMRTNKNAKVCMKASADYLKYLFE